MRYSTIVEKDDRTLLEIIGMLEQFDKDKFIAGLQMRHYSQFQIEQTLDMVRSYQARMNMEARALAHFSENFIQQFATDNNKCFKEAQRYFNRIRSTLCALKKVFQMTCRKSMAQLPEGAENPSAFERSPLGKGAYMVDMYGLASYNDVVQQLYHEMETLLVGATATLALCHQMIENEAMIREDAQMLKSIYQNSCQQLMGSIREYADLMEAPGLLSETELNRRRRKARSMDDFLRAEYHNVEKKEFKKFVWLEAVRQGRNDGLTEEETFLWPDNHEKVQTVRWAIENFDLMDVEGQQGKLDSVSMVCFLKWCGVERAKEKRLYQYFCDTYKGKFHPLVWSSISKERKEQREHGVTDRGAAATFQRMLDVVTELVAV
jgi:hypothetical protein